MPPHPWKYNDSYHIHDDYSYATTYSVSPPQPAVRLTPDAVREEASKKIAELRAKLQHLREQFEAVRDELRFWQQIPQE